MDRITLRDVHAAWGAPALVQLRFREDRPSCRVAQAVNEALQGAVQEAEAKLLQRLDEVTRATLSRDFHGHWAAHRTAAGHGRFHLEAHHDEAH